MKGSRVATAARCRQKCQAQTPSTQSPPLLPSHPSSRGQDEPRHKGGEYSTGRAKNETWRLSAQLTKTHAPGIDGSCRVGRDSRD